MHLILLDPIGLASRARSPGEREFIRAALRLEIPANRKIVDVLVAIPTFLLVVPRFPFVSFNFNVSIRRILRCASSNRNETTQSTSSRYHVVVGVKPSFKSRVDGLKFHLYGMPTWTTTEEHRRGWLLRWRYRRGFLKSDDVRFVLLKIRRSHRL